MNWDLVCLDTMILIWGIKKEAQDDQKHMIKHAEAFLKYLDDNKVKALIPAIVIGELLATVPSEKFAEINNHIMQNFIIASYDSIAAVQAARIWQKIKNNGSYNELINNPLTNRRIIKTDIQIIATALAGKANCIYSNDTDIHKIGKGIIEVQNMPTLYTPELAFD